MRDRWYRSIERVWIFAITAIRRRFPFLYPVLNFGNSLYCRIFFRDFKKNIHSASWNGLEANDRIDALSVKDAPELVKLVESASEASRRLFNPHPMTEKKFCSLMRAPYYFAIGYRRSGLLVGYAFIHIYFPKKAFAGYFVTDKYQNQGIGKALFRAIREIADEAATPLYTYVKEDNYASMRISADFVVEHRMPDGYILLRHPPLSAKGG